MWDIVDEVIDGVIAARCRDVDRGLSSDVGGALVGDRGLVDANRRKDGFETGVHGRVQAGAVEDPNQAVVGGVGDGELLEGEGLVLAVECRDVDGALDDGLQPSGRWGLESADYRAVDEKSGLFDPVLLQMVNSLTSNGDCGQMAHWRTNQY